MCIVLPVSHIPCTHTVAIWQHCIEATRFGQVSIKPCWNVKQHERSVITRRPCADCSGQRYFARRGGVAERGNGSSNTTPEGDTKSNDDDANDSGYHSDVIHEEEEASDRDECPLSPKALVPPQLRVKTNEQRKRTSSNHRPLTRKPSWRPNLKRELNLEYEPLFPPRRDSINSLISKFDAADILAAHMETRTDPRRETTPTRLTRQMRDSTLLHPSSPPPTETGQARLARAYPFPMMVDVRRLNEEGLRPRPRKNSTLLHPSSPTLGPITDTTNSTKQVRRPGHVRRESSLLHPSLPAEPVAVTAQHKTVISIPPRQRSATPPLQTLRRMPPLQTTQSEPQSATMARQRRASVLHSCLSVYEDVNDGGRRETFTFGRGGNDRWDGMRGYEREEAEEVMMKDTARVARESRRRG
jgi:hypothetical protein